MLAVKLKLIGKKGQHSFRVIVQEKKAKLQGKFVDDLGWYNPHSNQFKIDQEKLKHWIENGAQPTETVEKLIKKSAADSEVQSYEGRKRPKKKKKEKKPTEAPEAPAEGEKGEGGEESPDEAPAKEDSVEEEKGEEVKEETKEEEKAE